MDSKKLMLWPVIISIVVHVALISLSSLIDLRDNVKAAEVFTVKIEEPEEKVPAKKKEPAKNEKKPEPVNQKQATAPRDGWREDTVDLGSADTKYAGFLGIIKKKIQPVLDAFENKDEGIVVVKMSIDADGSLAQTVLMSSSGSVDLDEETLRIVRKAAPFGKLPAHYDLSRLHITASFRYRVIN